ncbi:MAG TPA: hypothetical protein VFQ40_02505 [Actinomycetota bacterium]|nr:hypothetical protein [Actinomycetota bacterium]
MSPTYEEPTFARLDGERLVCLCGGRQPWAFEPCDRHGNALPTYGIGDRSIVGCRLCGRVYTADGVLIDQRAAA